MITAKQVATQAMKQLQDAGQTVTAEQIAGIITNVLTMQPSPDKKARYQQIFDMIEEIPKSTPKQSKKK